MKEQENGEWYMIHENKHSLSDITSGYGVWGFGLDEKTKKIFVAPKNLELEILVDQVKFNQ